MKISKQAYGKLVKAHAPKSPLLKNCRNAFLVGGAICALGELLRNLFLSALGMNEEDAGLLVSVSLIFLSVVATGIGIFDRIAKIGGAGTLVPITGFANAVVSPAIDSKSEGLILGVGAKIFTVAGPVLLYGSLAGGIFGVVLWVCSL